MTATVAGIHLGIDTHANRPAANTVPDGSIYSCSDHSLVYKSNFAGNSWATWATVSAAGGGIPATLLDAKGDIIAASAADTAARLAAGANDTVLVAASGETTGLKWAAPLAGRARAYYRRTSGNYTVNTTSFADIDATNLNWTKTTGARRVRLWIKAGVSATTSGLTLELLVDGAALGGGDGGVWYSTIAGNDTKFVEVYTAVLTAASHTFKWQARMNVAGTGTIYAGTAAPATPLEAGLEESEFDT